MKFFEKSIVLIISFPLFHLLWIYRRDFHKQKKNERNLNSENKMHFSFTYNLEWLKTRYFYKLYPALYMIAIIGHFASAIYADQLEQIFPVYSENWRSFKITQIKYILGLYTQTCSVFTERNVWGVWYWFLKFPTKQTAVLKTLEGIKEEVVRIKMEENWIEIFLIKSNSKNTIEFKIRTMLYQKSLFLHLMSIWLNLFLSVFF